MQSESYFFSPKELCFYPLSLRESYIQANTWPEVLIPVAHEKYKNFQEVFPDKIIGADDDGNPIWKDKIISEEENILIISKKIKRLSAKYEDKIKILNYQKEIEGLNSSEELELLNFKKYILSLHKIPRQKGYPLNIKWPEEP